VGEQVLQHLLDKIAQEHGRARRKQRGNLVMDILAWGQNFLPRHFRLPPSRMHLWLAERLDALERHRGRKINLLGPRGSAKSTLGTLAFVAALPAGASLVGSWSAGRFSRLAAPLAAATVSSVPAVTSASYGSSRISIGLRWIVAALDESCGAREMKSSRL
jgi:hypothetical protein